jgi:hypothetical protein
MINESKISVKLIPCACGCNELVENTKTCHGVFRKFKRGHNRGNWNGGKLETNGYIMRLNPNHPFADSNGYIMEHRLVWEKYHKACLLPWIHIHHNNHVRDDNRIENLEPITKSEHHRLHNTKDMSNRLCLICNSKTTQLESKKYHKWYKYNDGFICKKCYFKKKLKI